jgi:flagellar hook-associated protein 3 FlgL
MRVTNKMMTDMVQANLHRTTSRLARLQDQISSGKQLLRPSDDPAGLTRALALRRAVGEGEQYLRNIDSASGWLGATDTALARATDLLGRANQIGLRGSNDTWSQQERSAIAGEVDQLIQELGQIGNTTFGDQYLFAGFKQGQVPFAVVDGPPSSATFQGDDGDLLRSVGVGTKVAVNVHGDAFTTALTALAGLRDALNAGDATQIRPRLADPDGGRAQLAGARADAGARANRLEHAAKQITSGLIDLKAQLSQIEDVDEAATAVAFTTEETLYRSALATAAKVIQPSLVDYLT